MKLPLKPLLLVLGLAASAYALVLLLTGGSQSLERLQDLATPSGLVAALLCLLNYALRGLRWRRWMAHYQRPLGLAEGLRIYLAGYAFTPTPANIGEAARGLLLTRHPLGPAQSLSIFGAERVADLLGLLLLALPALGWLFSLSTATSISWRVLAGAGLGFMLLALLLLRLRSGGWQRFEWLRQAWLCLAQRPLQWLALTLGAWIAQGLAVWLVCRMQGHDIDPLLAMGFYALAMVGGALSMLPAGLGGMEAILTGLLVAHGASLVDALAITVLVRLLTLWLAVAIGVLALLYSAGFRRDISLR